jgi:hypothetical protein
MGTTRPQAFATWLEAQMVQRNLSRRALGRVIDPEQPEQGRRTVIRHLSGEVFPVTESRRKYLDAFGLVDDPFAEAESEERQQIVAELLAIAARLERHVTSWVVV